MADLTIRVCDFHTPSKSSNKKISKESVKKALDSQAFKRRLESGGCLGLFTHTSRYELDNEHIPLEDNVATSPYLANCCRRMWIDESKDCLMGEFDLLDTQYGNLLKDMYKKGIMMNYSMSVSATADNNYYYVDDILGVDSTFRPDLNARVEKVNFSENPSERFIENYSSKPNKDGSMIMNFSYTPDLDDVHYQENTVKTPIIDDTPYVGQLSTNVNDYIVDKPGIHKEGHVVLSEEDTSRPVINPIEKYDVESAKPVKGSELGQQESVVNLDTGVSGEDTENINPDVNFDSETECECPKCHNMVPTSETCDINGEIICKTCADIKSETKLFDSMGITDSTDTSVSIEEIHEDIPVEDQLSLQELNTLPNEMTAQVDTMTEANFSIEKYAELLANKTTNFSIQQYITELTMQPYAILFRRVNEVIQLCRAKKQEWIDSNIDRLKSYFDSYVLTWINSSLNANTEFNIAIGLRLNKFNIDQESMRQLNLTIKKMKAQLASTGFISKIIQQQLNNQFQSIENDLYKFIDEKIKSSGKTFFPKDNNDDKGKK